MFGRKHQISRKMELRRDVCFAESPLIALRFMCSKTDIVEHALVRQHLNARLVLPRHSCVTKLFYLADFSVVLRHTLS